ncbi:organic solvent tolerance protein [Candidatus Pelagibacter ubique]|uniref:organic solvent tolerance protein n=1 Tax=Pelagibacter ubique TaxID=198252 RepID=UPI0003C7EAC5
MINKFKYLFFFIVLFSINPSFSIANDVFEFNVTNIEIKENGNIFKGTNGGEAFTNDVFIKAKNFEYNKKLNLLVSDGDVKLQDKKKNIIIIADKISYSKAKEIITAYGNAKIQDIDRKITIRSDQIEFKKNDEIISAYGDAKIKDIDRKMTIRSDQIEFRKNDQIITAITNVNLIDGINKIKIDSDKITYLMNEEKIFTQGKTFAEIQPTYKFFSEDVVFLKDEMKLSSNKKTIITNNKFSLYELGSFVYQIEEEFLKGTDITITSNTNVPPGESDKMFFESGFFDLKKENFQTATTIIKLKKNTFKRSDNDPRIYGASTSKKGKITSIKKAVFTSCKKTDKCPPWQLQASEIKHDKNKQQLIYNDTILKIYDVPVFYFPKFFHPDPTVKRQSGFLSPKFGNSNTLGSSLSVPYFYAISDNKDLTFSPTFFSKETKIFQSEYRQKNQNSSFIGDYGFTNSYKPSDSSKKKNVNHLFAKFEKNLKLNNFFTSNFNIFIEKTSNDSYLKIFNDNLAKSPIKPENTDSLHSGLNLFVENEKFSLLGGTDIFEDLSLNQNDRYQFVLPYYNYSKFLNPTNYGTFEFDSQGDNILENTNVLKSKIVNNFNFKSNDKIINGLGLSNNFNIFFKNLNSLGKNTTEYKSSGQSELQSLLEINSELPLLKISERYNETLMPKISIRFNPGEMKNHSADERTINVSNIFDTNRLGINDSLEAGNSVTLGIQYEKNNKVNNDNYLKISLASAFRDVEEDNISKQTSLNQKSSNVFGSIDFGLSKAINLDYKFAIDNNIQEFEYNSFGVNLSLNNFVTTFNFVEDNASLNNANYFETSSKFDFDESNSISFKTRRNREISLTEYYDLVYEYNNDCMTAGIKYNKTYYDDGDFKPTENIMFTISLFPLTTIQQSTKTE